MSVKFKKIDEGIFSPAIFNKDGSLKLGPTNSFIKYEATCDDLDELITTLNTLRRVLLDYVPTYAFDPTTIEIIKNTSIFNNDMLKLRLSQLPIFDTVCELDYIEPGTHPKYKKSIDIAVDITNDTVDKMNVTTDHITYFEDGKIVTGKYEKSGPILLVKLAPKQTVQFALHATIGDGETNKIWSCVSNAFYTYDEKSLTGIFTIESQGQMNERELLVRACKHIMTKLTIIHDKLIDKLKTQESYIYLDPHGRLTDIDITLLPKVDTHDAIFLEIIDEDYTLGNLLVDALQMDKDIIFAGLSKPDQLVKRIVIKIQTKISLDKIIDRVFEKLVSDFKKYEKIFSYDSKKEYDSIPKDIKKKESKK